MKTLPLTISLLAGLWLAVAPAFAADALHFLKHGKPDASALLPPPPASGSAEQAADLDEVRAVSRAAGTRDVAAAMSEKKISVFNFTPVIGPFFTESNLPQTAQFFAKIQSDASEITDDGKDFFKRPRPYSVDPSLANGKAEKSFSYPSGHSTESMVLGLVLAELFPEKRDAILEQARAMGWRRVQYARHYPTDIYAGRTLAIAIAKQLEKNDDFHEELETVKREIKKTMEKQQTSAQL